PDHVLQDVVYKLVPGFYQGNCVQCITKNPLFNVSRQVFPVRYLRCSSQVTVNVLKKFVLTKFGIPLSHEAEIIRCDEILTDELTINEISRIYGLHTK
ncbi:hypothetical protein QZH41_015451, partial [Actinostola sp. cb2023]